MTDEELVQQAEDYFGMVGAYGKSWIERGGRSMVIVHLRYYSPEGESLGGVAVRGASSWPGHIWARQFEDTVKL